MKNKVYRMYSLIKKIGLFLILAFFVISCSNSKKVTEESLEIDNSKNNSIYRFSVSFFSKGGGTDRKARSEFESFIEAYNKKNNVILQFTKTPWGREGEVDYCFMLDELKKKEQGVFIKECENLLKDSKLVNLQEFTPCRNR